MRARLVSLYGESEIYERFFFTLKKSIIENDGEAVASLNRDPLRVNLPNGTEFFNTQQVFVEKYSSIITAEMLQVVKQQQISDLFANSSGAHIGAGRIWFRGAYTERETDTPFSEVTVQVITYNVN